jgi:hypothetical protein
MSGYKDVEATLNDLQHAVQQWLIDNYQSPVAQPEASQLPIETSDEGFDVPY